MKRRPTAEKPQPAKPSRASSSEGITRFLESLPADRRREFDRVRKVVRQHLPAGYEETVSGRMLVYQVPFARFSDTHNGRPLWYAALVSEKSYLSLHLMPIYGNEALARQLVDAFRAAGKRLNMGKACIRFQKADDLDLDAVGKVVASVPLERWIEITQAARRR